jgi:hypothetical protein
MIKQKDRSRYAERPEANLCYHSGDREDYQSCFAVNAGRPQEKQANTAVNAELH